MRILFVTDTYTPQVNGVTTVLERMVRFLASERHELRVVAPRYPAHDESPGELRIPSLAFPPYPDIRLSNPAFRRVSRLVDQFAPELIHVATEGPLGLVGRMVSTTRGIPLVTSFHTDFPRYCRDYGVPWLEPAVWRWLTWFHGRAAMIHTPGTAVRNSLHARGLTRATVWGRGVDTAFFRPDRRSMAWRRRYDIPDDAMVVCHVGRLAREKNLGVLLDAWAILRESVTRSVVCVVAGDGPLAPEIRRRAPFARQFGFLKRDQLATLYASCEACVLPSFTETCGLVALEAMASGIPVVAANAGGFRETIVHGQSGLLVPAHDPKAFAAAIVWLASDPQYRKSLGADARRHAERRDLTAENLQLLTQYAAITSHSFEEVLCSAAS
jgi:glycosyltransferase involved in cell wall biosynthesis